MPKLINVVIRIFDKNTKTMKEVTVQDLKQKIDNNEPFQLIDVRETFEYETSNLDGLNIPLGGILIEADKIDRDKPVIVQCRSGKRSAAAIMQLEQVHGFDNLHNLKGGILAWQEAYDPNMPVY
ncbi:putative adenylyltransferase/sulfurtransferase MoeZ [compost metagenome]